MIIENLTVLLFHPHPTLDKLEEHFPKLTPFKVIIAKEKTTTHNRQRQKGKLISKE